MPHRLLPLAILFVGLGLSGAVSVARADGADEAVVAQPTADEVAAADLKELGKTVGKQPGHDAAATAKKLVELWKDEALAEETKKPIPGYLQSIAKQTDEHASVAGVEALAELGAEHATKTVTTVLKRELKAKEPRKGVWLACLRSMGKVADPGKTAVNTLTDLLTHKDHNVVNFALHAIAGYGKAPGKLRKELLEELLKHFGSEFNEAWASNTNLERSNAISRGLGTAINALTRDAQFELKRLREWLRENKDNKDVWKD